jgi:hypothetical protein
MSETGFAAERGAELLPAVGRVRIAMGELLLEPVSKNVAHISNRLVRTLSPPREPKPGECHKLLACRAYRGSRSS